MILAFPKNPIAAATHANPYPYYRQLLEQEPLYFDRDLNLWVASSAKVITAILEHPDCRVRPISEPIPKTLLGSSAADIFGHLVRMNDGTLHCPLKKSVNATFDGLAPSTMTRVAQFWVAKLFQTEAQLMLEYPAFVVGDLLGLPHDSLEKMAILIADFVRCIAPNCPPEQLEQGKLAATQLFEIFEATAQTGLLADLTAQTKHFGLENSKLVTANAIGFLSQTFDATAGLIGNTLLALARDPALLDQPLADVIQEVVRFDPSVQNTRRFVSEDCIIAGQSMKAGDVILVVLAAANHDKSVNPNPEEFLVTREHRRIFTFGHGVHACPGTNLAVCIAEHAVARALEVQVNLKALLNDFSYRPSLNGRIPIFGGRR